MMMEFHGFLAYSAEGLVHNWHSPVATCSGGAVEQLDFGACAVCCTGKRLQGGARINCGGAIDIVDRRFDLDLKVHIAALPADEICTA